MIEVLLSIILAPVAIVAAVSLFILAAGLVLGIKKSMKKNRQNNEI